MADTKWIYVENTYICIVQLSMLVMGSMLVHYGKKLDDIEDTPVDYIR